MASRQPPFLWLLWLNSPAHKLYQRTIGVALRGAYRVLEFLWESTDHIPSSLPTTGFFIVVAIIQTYVQAEGKVASGFSVIAARYAWIDWWQIVAMFVLGAMLSAYNTSAVSRSATSLVMAWYSYELIVASFNGSLNVLGYLAATYIAFFGLQALVTARREVAYVHLLVSVRRQQGEIVKHNRQIEGLQTQIQGLVKASDRRNDTPD